MSQPNILVITSDQQRPDALGCVRSFVKTPNLDRLASEGVRFSKGYTSSPICVAGRACLATGLEVHQNRCWSSCEPYHGQFRSWHHMLRDHGYDTTSIGKLHFRSTEDDNGFDEEIYPVHVVNGIGHPYCILRRPSVLMDEIADFVDDIGWGESSYTQYDRAVANTSAEWLHDRAKSGSDKPWGTYVSFVAPHHPLVAPEEFKDLYPPEDLPLPYAYVPPPNPHPSVHAHPAVKAMEDCMHYHRLMKDEAFVRQLCAYYWGLVSSLDKNVGIVLDALEESGQAENTLVIFSSDHGEMLGDRGVWTKSHLYESSIGVPMIARGPGFPTGHVCDTPVTLVDVFPTIAEAISAPGEAAGLPGAAMQKFAESENPDRSIISAYHDYGAITGFTALRWKNWKYNHFAGYEPQLFDLDADPHELRDLASDPAHAGIRAACDARLREHVDPDAASDLAFADQEIKIAALGGEEKLRNAEQLHYTPMPEVIA